MEKGIFIVFEGIDGSGKSSCMDAVASEMQKMNRPAIKTAEPTDSKIGSLIRTSSDLTPEAEALLFVADRAQHTREIITQMNEGKTVLCDRYYASTLAYQSAKLNERPVSLRWLKMLNNKVTIEPDVTFLFDIDPELGLERVESRGSKSRFERIGYLREVRKNYLRIAKEHDFVIIDASKSREEVLADVMRHISEVIRQKDKE